MEKQERKEKEEEGKKEGKKEKKEKKEKEKKKGDGNLKIKFEIYFVWHIYGEGKKGGKEKRKVN